MDLFSSRSTQGALRRASENLQGRLLLQSAVAWVLPIQLPVNGCLRDAAVNHALREAVVSLSKVPRFHSISVACLECGSNENIPCMAELAIYIP
jgi:hypothetical protein